jgi:hypothetical protein
MKYKIYAGLSGSFGGATYQETLEFDNEEEAYQCSFDYACEIYEMYSFHFKSVDQIMEEEKCNEETAIEIYNEERESWLSYYIEEIKD